jgi:hypothetical protein
MSDTDLPVRIKHNQFVQLGDVTVNIDKVIQVYRDSKNKAGACWVDVGRANDINVHLPLEEATKLLNFQGG